MNKMNAENINLPLQQRDLDNIKKDISYILSSAERCGLTGADIGDDYIAMNSKAMDVHRYKCDDVDAFVRTHCLDIAECRRFLWFPKPQPSPAAAVATSVRPQPPMLLTPKDTPPDRKRKSTGEAVGRTRPCKCSMQLWSQVATLTGAVESLIHRIGALEDKIDELVQQKEN